MTRLVSRSNMDELFPAMVVGLERARVKTSLGKYWTIENAMASMVNFEVYGFIQESSGYSGIFAIEQSPQRRLMDVFWGGKDPHNKTPIDEVELDAFFTACAKYFECDSIAIKGRKGWEKMAQRQGYLEDSRTYIKDIS